MLKQLFTRRQRRVLLSRRERKVSNLTEPQRTPYDPAEPPYRELKLDEKTAALVEEIRTLRKAVQA